MDDSQRQEAKWKGPETKDCVIPGSSRKGKTIIAKLTSGFQGLGVGETGNEYKDTQRKFFFKKRRKWNSLYSQIVKVKVNQLCLTLCDPNSPRQSTGVGSLSLLQGILPTQGSNPGLLHCRHILYQLSHSSVAQSCPTLCNPMNRSTPGLPVHHQFLELTQTHILWVSDTIQPSHPVIPFFSCPQSLPALGSFPMSQLFTWGGQSTGVSALASFLPKSHKGSPIHR